MSRAEFQLEPLTCPTCIKKIEGVLGKMKGVIDARVLFNSSKVKVAVYPRSSFIKTRHVV